MQQSARLPVLGSWDIAPRPDTGHRIASLTAIAMVLISAAMPSRDGDDAELATAGASSPLLTTPPPTRELMAAFYMGVPYTYDSDVIFKKPGKHDFTLKNVEWQGKPFENPIFYGWRFTQWLDGGMTGAMVDFTHSKAISDRTKDAKMEGTYDGKPAPTDKKIGEIFPKLEFSHGHNMLTLNGLLRLAQPYPKLFPYIGLGAGIGLPHTEIQMLSDEGRTYEYQYAGPVLQALIGVEIRVKRASYFLEYKFSLARYDAPLSGRNTTWLGSDLWSQFSRWIKGEPPRDGTAETRLTSHNFIFGLGVRFPSALAVAP